MLTPYRQKYNPKKPETKIKHLKSVVQVFFKKNFSAGKIQGKPSVLEKSAACLHK